MSCIRKQTSTDEVECNNISRFTGGGDYTGGRGCWSQVVPFLRKNLNQAFPHFSIPIPHPFPRTTLLVSWVDSCLVNENKQKPHAAHSINKIRKRT